MPRMILRLLAAFVLAQAAVLLVDPGLLMVESFWMSTSGQLGAVARSILGGLALVYGAREARFSTFLKVHGGLSFLFVVVYALQGDDWPALQWESETATDKLMTYSASRPSTVPEMAKVT